MKTKEQLIIEATSTEFLSRDQLSGLTPSQLRELTFSQLRELTPDQLSGLTPSQLSGLTPSQLRGLTPYQLSGLTPSQLSGLTPSQLAFFDKIKSYSWKKPYTKLLEAIKRPGCALNMTSWHGCETTHCIAGWTTTLAPKGKELEAEIGTGAAARLILLASRPDAPLPRFDRNAPEDAIMAFVEARAAEEAE